MYEKLLKTLILGSSNMEKLPDGIFGELQDLGFTVDAAKDPEDQVLEALAFYAALSKAAKKLPILNAADLIISAENELLENCPEAAKNLFAKLLKRDEALLISRFLEVLDQNNWRLSAEHLPELLDLGIKHKNLRPKISKCGGERAKWLTQFNKEWNYLLPREIEEDAFYTADRESRIEYLRKIRAQHPEAALTLILKIWKTEDHQTKLECLKLLQNKLGKSDLELLETAEKDGRKEIRAEAIRLMSLIPGSKLVQAFEEYLDKNLSFNTPSNGSGISFNNIKVEGILSAYGIQENFKALSEGKQANLQAQIIAAVPPLYWKIRKGPDFKSFLETVYKDDFKSAWFWGLGKAAQKFDDLEMMIEMHRFLFKNTDVRQYGFSFDPAFICENMDAELFDRVTLAYLNRDKMDQPMLFSLLNQLRPWSEALSFKVIQQLKTLAADSKSNYERYWINILHLSAYNIDVNVLNFAAENWPEQRAAVWERQLESFFEIIGLRKDIYNLNATINEQS